MVGRIDRVGHGGLGDFVDLAGAELEGVSKAVVFAAELGVLLAFELSRPFVVASVGSKEGVVFGGNHDDPWVVWWERTRKLKKLS